MIINKNVGKSQKLIIFLIKIELEMRIKILFITQ